MPFVPINHSAILRPKPTPEKQAYPSSFDAKDFRWVGPAAKGRRTLEYTGFRPPLRIEMHRLQDGGYSLGSMSDPVLGPAAEDAFAWCGGLPALGLAATWFANSR
jgi:hypothetical protein